MEPLQYEPGRAHGTPARSAMRLVITYAVAVTNIVLIALILREVYRRYPENHWAVDLRWLWAWCAVGAGFALVQGALCRRWWSAGAMLVTAILLASAVWFIDHYSLLLPYETWLKAGMPGPWKVR